jgi:hypothetical protein
MTFIFGRCGANFGWFVHITAYISIIPTGQEAELMGMFRYVCKGFLLRSPRIYILNELLTWRTVWDLSIFLSQRVSPAYFVSATTTVQSRTCGKRSNYPGHAFGREPEPEPVVGSPGEFT